MQTIKPLFAIFLFTIGGLAHAAPSIFDFVADANSQERGFASSYVKTVGGITLTATAANGRHPYLDSGHGGLGVCGTLTTATNPQCNPASDDNIVNGEILILSFNQAVTINQMWFNNRHDGDGSLSGDKVKVAGTIYSLLQDTGTSFANFKNDWSPRVGTTGPFQTFSFAANTDYWIENPNTNGNNGEFYLSGMSVVAVPEPETYAMMLAGLGLMGLVARRRKQKLSA